MILVIDDNRAGVRHYIERLESSGWFVEVAEDPDEALSLLASRASEVELALLDVAMPTGEAFASEDTDEGLETGTLLLRRLKREYPDLPVIVLTVTNSMSLRDEGYVVLEKQDTLPSELVERVSNLLGSKEPK